MNATLRILVLYASTHGHTAKIAARIAAALEQDGATVDLHQLRPNETEPAPPGYDAVILGASNHAGHHQRELVRWAERHHTAVGMIPSAFFSVCLTVADDTEESRAATRGYLDDFVEETGWTPGRRTTTTRTGTPWTAGRTSSPRCSSWRPRRHELPVSRARRRGVALRHPDGRGGRSVIRG